MKSILVPIGSNEQAANTLQYAIDFAEIVKAKIYITQIYGVTKVAGSLKKIDAILQIDSDKELQDVLSKVDKKNIEIISKSIKGHDIINSIDRISKQLDIDLIISSAKNISVNKKVYLGKVAGGIIKNTDLPILIIPSNYSFNPINKVLMAVKSGILKSENILNPIKTILQNFNAKLNLLQVNTPTAKVEDLMIDEKLNELKNSIVVTENATIFQGVLQHLSSHNPDMLCVIRRKRGFFKKLWEQNRVKKADFESRIPLLVLKGN
jgi:nucleotide-binding universal stress UspA family protein